MKLEFTEAEWLAIADLLKALVAKDVLRANVSELINHPVIQDVVHAATTEEVKRKLRELYGPEDKDESVVVR